MSTEHICRALFALFAIGLLAGCTLGKSYSQIDPEGALEDIRKHNGYHEMASISPGRAKVLFRSEGSGALVVFASSTSPVACEGFSKLEPVRNSGRGVLYPWIADMTMAHSNAKGFRVKEFEPTEGLQVRSSAWLSGGTGFRSQRCGPVASRFRVNADRIYLVEYVWEGNTCRQDIFDVTDRNSPQVLPAEPLLACKE